VCRKGWGYAVQYCCGLAASGGGRDGGTMEGGLQDVHCPMPNTAPLTHTCPLCAHLLLLIPSPPPSSHTCPQVDVSDWFTGGHLGTQIQTTNWQVVNCTTPANYFHVRRRPVRLGGGGGGAGSMIGRMACKGRKGRAACSF
jgi:hypothetical protein